MVTPGSSALSLLLCGSLLLWGCQWIDPTQVHCSGSSVARCTAFSGYTCDVQAGRCVASSSSGDETVPGVLNGGGGSTGDDDDDGSGGGGTGGTSPCEDDDHEPNDSLLYASGISSPVSSVTMPNLKACDEDWYSFSPDEGQVTIGLNFDNKLADLELRLFRDVNSELDNSLTQDNFEVIGPLTLDREETYYIQVHEFDGSYVGSSYEMTIQVSPHGSTR